MDLRHLIFNTIDHGRQLSVCVKFVSKFFSSVHICVTHTQTEAGIVEQFLDDMREVVEALKLEPNAAPKGSVSGHI